MKFHASRHVPTPSAKLPAALPELTWPTPPAICPVCDSQQVNHVKHSWGEFITYACFFEVGRDDEGWHLYSVCENMAAAVAQRQRAEDAERDYAVLLADYNAAAAWLGVLESGDDLEVAAKSLTDQLSDVLQRADKAEAELTFAEAFGENAALQFAQEYKRADAQQTELDKAIAAAVSQYEQRVRLVADYDKLDEERDALAAQVAALRAALDSIVEYAGPADDTGNSFWQCRACGWPVGPIRSRRDAVEHAPDCAYIAAKSALAAAPDPNAPSAVPARRRTDVSDKAYNAGAEAMRAA